MCDQFMDLMGLEGLCENIKAMIDFITNTTLKDTCLKFASKETDDTSTSESH